MYDRNNLGVFKLRKESIGEESLKTEETKVITVTFLFMADSRKFRESPCSQPLSKLSKYNPGGMPMSQADYEDSLH